MSEKLMMIAFPFSANMSMNSHQLGRHSRRVMDEWTLWWDASAKLFVVVADQSVAWLMQHKYFVLESELRSIRWHFGSPQANEPAHAWMKMYHLPVRVTGESSMTRSWVSWSTTTHAVHPKQPEQPFDEYWTRVHHWAGDWFESQASIVEHRATFLDDFCHEEC
jgi:hypothetical protein